MCRDAARWSRAVGERQAAEFIRLRHGSQAAVPRASPKRQAGIFPLSSHGNLNIYNPAF